MSWQEIESRFPTPEDFIFWLVKILHSPPDPIVGSKVIIDRYTNQRIIIRTIGDKEMPNDDIDWNDCLPFTGPESLLPTGTHMPKGISVLDMIREGSLKRTASGGIISLEVDNDAYAELTATYPGQILIATADGDMITREAWYEQFNQSDGLKLAIIRELNKGQNSPKTVVIT